MSRFDAPLPNPKVTWVPNVLGETLKVGRRNCGTIWQGGGGAWMAALIVDGSSTIHGPFLDSQAAARFLYQKCAPWMVTDDQKDRDNQP
jgi:hypothetical protein